MSPNGRVLRNPRNEWYLICAVLLLRTWALSNGKTLMGVSGKEKEQSAGKGAPGPTPVQAC